MHHYKHRVTKSDIEAIRREAFKEAAARVVHLGEVHQVGFATELLAEEILALGESEPKPDPRSRTSGHTSSTATAPIRSSAFLQKLQP